MERWSAGVLHSSVWCEEPSENLPNAPRPISQYSSSGSAAAACGCAPDSSVTTWASGSAGVSVVGSCVVDRATLLEEDALDELDDELEEVLVDSSSAGEGAASGDEHALMKMVRRVPSRSRGDLVGMVGCLSGSG